MGELYWQVFFAFWPLWLLFAGMFLIALLVALYKQKCLLASGINDIDRMDGKTFERYLEALFERKGYIVERTDVEGLFDKGADLILIKGGVRTAVQAKRWKNPVKVDAVRAVVASKDSYHCDEAMVVTNSSFTRPAIEQARDSKVALWDRERLVKELLSVQKEERVGAATCLAAAVAPAQAAPLRAVPPPSFESGSDACEVCGRQISEKVKQYCLSHDRRFGGYVYCFEHQKQFGRLVWISQFKDGR